MFVKEGDEVSVENLIKGIIVDSGRCLRSHCRACGWQRAWFFSNHEPTSRSIGMASSHFTDSTGLPNQTNTTAKI